MCRRSVARAFLVQAGAHYDPAKKDENVSLLSLGIERYCRLRCRRVSSRFEAADHFCLPATSAVVNQQEKTRRHIEDRGHIKIVAICFKRGKSENKQG